MIRELTTMDDLARVLKLAREFYDSSFMSDIPCNPEVLGRTAMRWAESDNVFIGLGFRDKVKAPDDKNHPVGFVVACVQSIYTEQPMGQLELMYVQPKWRTTTPIAFELLAGAMEFFGQKDCCFVMAGNQGGVSEKDDRRAANFYMKAGFSPFGNCFGWKPQEVTNGHG